MAHGNDDAQFAIDVHFRRFEATCSMVERELLIPPMV
jgi:hypothetical protein